MGRFEKKSHKLMECILDIIHIIVTVAVLLFTARAIIYVDKDFASNISMAKIRDTIFNIGLNELFTYIGALGFVLFGIVGIYDYCYNNGIRPLYPTYYAKAKRKSQLKNTQKMMKIYYDNDIEFIRQYEAERIGYLFQSIGIDEGQFRHIKYELVKARAMSADTEENLRNKAKEIIYNADVIEDLTCIDEHDRVYRSVNYFVNLYTALYDTQLCEDIGKIMASFIAFRMDEKQMEELNYIIVPCGSNLLLGLEVGKILKKKVIAIHKKGRIQISKSWDGVYNYTGNKNKVIILHDVLVSGERIYRSVEKLPKDTYEIQGLFCLFKYEHEGDTPEKNLAEKNINNINCLIETNEDILKKYVKKVEGGN